MASPERHDTAWEATGDALRPEQGHKTRFGNMHPPRRHIDRRCRRLIRSLHAPLAQEERMTSLGQMSGYDSSSRTRDNSNIRQYGIVANWAGVSNPPDCAAPNPHPNLRPGHGEHGVGESDQSGLVRLPNIKARTGARSAVVLCLRREVKQLEGEAQASSNRNQAPGAARGHPQGHRSPTLVLLSALRAWYAADPTDFRHGRGVD